MSNIFIHKQTKQEVSLIHVAKQAKTQETMAVYEKESDRSVWVIPLNEFNHNFEQHDYSNHNHFTTA